MNELFKIGFLPVGFFDILDIIIVGILFYQVYKLLRGTIAFNIFLGLIFLYFLYGLVKQLHMDLLREVMESFLGIGGLVLIIIFQPELRRILLMIGNRTLGNRTRIFDRFMHRTFGTTGNIEAEVTAISDVVNQMAKQKTGALIVLNPGLVLEGIIIGGTDINAQVSTPLIQTIFQKDTPLHDGAMLIENQKIKKAGCILPVSKSDNIPKNLGLRHRAALGLVSRADVGVIVVSEETGGIRFAHKEELEVIKDTARLLVLINQYYEGM